MVRHTLKILPQMLQDFKSVSDHFGTLYIKGLTREWKNKSLTFELVTREFRTSR